MLLARYARCEAKKNNCNIGPENPQGECPITSNYVQLQITNYNLSIESTQYNAI